LLEASRSIISRVSTSPGNNSFLYWQGKRRVYYIRFLSEMVFSSEGVPSHSGSAQDVALGTQDNQ
jgi:hypothetical protein